MADIPSDRVKMNDIEVDIEKTLGESYQNKRAANINAMNDLALTQVNQAEYLWNKLTNGIYNFVVPDFVNRLYVTGAGGGGGGQGGGGGAQISYNAQGGSGGEVYDAIVAVTPGQNISVNIGTGGLGGGLVLSNVTEADAADGNPTSFGSLTWLGGIGGKYVGGGVGTKSASPARVGGFSGDGGATTASGFGNNGESTIYAAGGIGGQQVAVLALNGTGGGASYGAGGFGGTVGVAGGPGFLGGGGGAGGTSNVLGGNGGDGIIIIRW